VVKIVSECRRIFTFQNVLRNSINITTLDQCNLVSMRMCASGSLMKTIRISDMRYSMYGTTRLSTKRHSTICRLSFRLVLSRGPLKIRSLQYTLEPIFGPFSAGVVYSVSLTCCGIARNGVIRRWQRLKCK
jgi:hypothetical protein